MNLVLLSQSKEHFDRKIWQLNTYFPRNLSSEELSNKFIKKESFYKIYLLESTPATCGKLGDQASESNHSSICASIVKSYVTDIASLFMRLMDLNKHICICTNSVISKNITR